MSSGRKPRIVIIGGGFGGLYAALSLRRVDAEITLIDRRNFHLFQPLLYQVATGGLSPANIAAPLRSILRRQKNVEVQLGEVAEIRVPERIVALHDGREISYDTLLVAAGARHAYFGNDHWEPLAPGLKTLEDATDIRRRVLLAFEAAEAETKAEDDLGWQTFVVVGGGPTGVEMAGTIAELAHHTLVHDFHRIDPRKSRVILMEGLPRILNGMAEDLSAKGAVQLEELGVEVKTGCMVTQLDPQTVTYREGETEHQLPARTVIWAAGVQASPLAKQLAEATGAEADRAGRVLVEPDLTLPGHPEIFVIGDMASYLHQGGKPLPGLAPVAMQQGSYVARCIQARLANKPQPKFHYKDRGTMATIGRSRAVADIAGYRFGGFFAWAAWLLIHLAFLVQFESRILVLMQWAWNYLTRNRSARLITGEPLLPEDTGVESSEARNSEATLSHPGE